MTFLSRTFLTLFIFSIISLSVSKMNLQKFKEMFGVDDQRSVRLSKGFSHMEDSKQFNKEKNFRRVRSSIPQTQKAFTYFTLYFNSSTQIRRSAPDQQHTVVIAIQQNNLDIIQTLLNDVSDPSSPSYGQHLSFEQVLYFLYNE